MSISVVIVLVILQHVPRACAVSLQKVAYLEVEIIEPSQLI